MQTGGYSPPAKFFHWLVALCVLLIVPIGFLMGRVGGPLSTGLYNAHKSLGVLILALMTLRILYRLLRGAPPPEPTLKPWERFVSATVHWLLYALLIVQPILGLFANSAYGAVTPFFGLFEIQPIVAKDTALSNKLFYWHSWLGWTIAALFCLHIAGALRHYLIRSDGVMQRMLPKAMGGA